MLIHIVFGIHMQTDECGAIRWFLSSMDRKDISRSAAENIIYCFNVEKNSNKWAWTTEVRSVPDNKQISPKLFSIHMMSKPNENGHCMYAHLPKLKKPVPLFVLFRALGVISDKRICEYILLNCDFERMDGEKGKMEMMRNMLYMLKASIIESNSIKTQEEAFDYIMKQVMYNPYNQVSQADGQKKKREYTETAIHDDFLPHCETKQQKLYFIGYMIYKLFKTKMGILKESDRDSHINKRIDTT